MTEFRLTSDMYQLTGDGECKAFLSIQALGIGDVISPVRDKSIRFIILDRPVPDIGGWVYRVSPMDEESLGRLVLQDFHRKWTVFIKAASHGYSGDMDWGPAKPFEETLTPQQALELAIETLENFRDEYGDVGPIIDKLKKAL